MGKNENVKLELPEGLEPVSTEMSEEKREELIVAYREKQRSKFEQRLKDRVESFEKKLLEKQTKDHEILVRKILIGNLREEIKSKREAIKALQGQIKELRPKRVKDGGKAKTKATEKKTTKAA